MGIKFSYGRARWSYMEFHALRRAIAAAIEIDLDNMDGYEGDQRWDSMSDPLVYLLDARDIDGVIPVDHCFDVAHRLEDLLSTVENLSYDYIQVRELIQGLKDAAWFGKDFLFLPDQDESDPNKELKLRLSVN